MSVYRKPSASEACNWTSNLDPAGYIGIINKGVLVCLKWIAELELIETVKVYVMLS